ncbi:hypothetical protein [Auritidibacter ignavus]|nr:hypothetical protein [Auritidibacter ignavus]WHS35304.1 hypothetical protein QM403_01725 [Auritidibacter ignavus]
MNPTIAPRLKGTILPAPWSKVPGELEVVEGVVIADSLCSEALWHQHW